MAKKTVALITGLVLVTILLFIVAKNNAHGWYSQDKVTVCHPTGSEKHPYTVITIDANGVQSGDFIYGGTFDKHHKGNPEWCEENKPTPTPTETPTLTQVPTEYPCERGDVSWDEMATPCPTIPTPTPTASPSATPTPTPDNNNSGGGSSGGGQSNNAPAAVVCTNPFAAPAISSITAGQSGELVVNWGEADTSINHYSLVYGLVGQAMNMGVDNIPNTSTSFTIGSLPVGASINAQVWAWKDGCAEMSSVVDPIVR